MFRMGGSTENVGIMDGMRQRYAESDPKGVQPKGVKPNGYMDK